MNQLISRQAVLDIVDDYKLFKVLAELPTITPQVYINVTGGVADIICADHKVGVTVLDYDITDNEDDNYAVDENGKQVWIYGETATVDPDKCQMIVGYPSLAETRE